MNTILYSSVIGSMMVVICGLFSIVFLLHLENQRLRKTTEDQQKVLDDLSLKFLKKSSRHWEA